MEEYVKLGHASITDLNRWMKNIGVKFYTE